MRNLFKIALPLLMIAVLMSCNRDKNHPGYTYFPDMAYSQAAETYSPSAVFADGRTMITPAEGTIPRGFTPYPFKAKSFEDQVAAGKTLMNPLEANTAVITEGKRQYEIFCIHCHGVQGKGDGHLYTSKLFLAKPANLMDPITQNKPDGEIYHIITMGTLSGLMGPHGSQVPPQNRWAIIHYLRQLAK